MKVRVAISKRRSKIVAAAVIVYWRGFGLWQTFSYSLTDDKVVPICSSPSKTLADALSGACETFKVKPADFVKVEESGLEDFIRKNARNRWYPSQHKRFRSAENRKR